MWVKFEKAEFTVSIHGVELKLEDHYISPSYECTENGLKHVVTQLILYYCEGVTAKNNNIKLKKITLKH